MIEAILGDSMKIMPAIAENVRPSFDCIFIDPPYFEWADRPLPHGEAKDRFAQGGEKPEHNRLAYWARRLLKPNGTVWLCGSQPQMLDDWMYWKPAFRLVFELIQYKISGTPPINRWQPIRVHESIWCLVLKDAKMATTHIDISRTGGTMVTEVRKQKPEDAMSIRYGGQWQEWREGVGYMKSVHVSSQIKGGSREYYGHPTQKPLSLMKQIIKVSTGKKDWVLDPFAGSGTTLQACWELERNCIGIEINREYMAMIRKRLEICRAIKRLTQF